VTLARSGSVHSPRALCDVTSARHRYASALRAKVSEAERIRPSGPW
jgi:hypothetical protein